MQTLIIDSKEIRVIEGLYCLNDLHRASGTSKSKSPREWARLVQTQELIAEIEQAPDMVPGIQAGNHPLALKTHHGGPNRGTYACKELVYSYAMWISAKFHLHVIRAFEALMNPKKLNQLPGTYRVLQTIQGDEVTERRILTDDEFVTTLKMMLAYFKDEGKVVVSEKDLVAINRSHMCLRVGMKVGGPVWDRIAEETGDEHYKMPNPLECGLTA